MDKVKMETIMPMEARDEAAEILGALTSLSVKEQRDLLVFMQGVQLGRRLAAEAAG